MRESGGHMPVTEIPKKTALEFNNPVYTRHLKVLRSRFESPSQRVSDFPIYEDDGTVLTIHKVPTGGGRIFGKNEEFYTEGIAGCIGILIQTKEKNVMIHATPTTPQSYPHHYPEATAQEIARILRSQGVDVDSARVVILGTLGHESGKYGYKNENARWNTLADMLKAQGFASTKVVEVPVADMTLYHNPEIPDQILAIGRRAFYNESGKHDVDPLLREEYLISLDSTVQQDFGIVRPIRVKEEGE